MTKAHSKRLRKLTEQEISQLDNVKDSCRENAVTPIKITQKTTAGYALDFTKYLASGYVDEAFNYGWDKIVSDNQDEKCKTDDPSGKVYRNSILVGAALWFAFPAVIATIVTIAAPPVGLVAFGIAAIFGVVGAVVGAVDGYSETRTIKRAIELGENNAQKEMSGIVNKTEERAKLKDEIKNELIREKALEKASGNISIKDATPLQNNNSQANSVAAA